MPLHSICHSRHLSSCIQGMCTTVTGPLLQGQSSGLPAQPPVVPDRPGTLRAVYHYPTGTEYPPSARGCKPGLLDIMSYQALFLSPITSGGSKDMAYMGAVFIPGYWNALFPAGAWLSGVRVPHFSPSEFLCLWCKLLRPTPAVSR